VKKSVLFLLVLMFGFVLVGCGGEAVTQEDYDNLRAEFNSLQATIVTLQGQYDVTRSDLEALQTENENLQAEIVSLQTGSASTQDVTGSESGDVEVFVHEDEYVTISFVGTELDRGNESLVFLVENHTDFELTFQSSSMAIDGESLGHISGSSSVTAQSRGRIRFRSRENFPTMSPETISGNIRVIDFSRTLFRSYDVDFVNLEVR